MTMNLLESLFLNYVDLKQTNIIYFKQSTPINYVWNIYTLVI